MGPTGKTTSRPEHLLRHTKAALFFLIWASLVLLVESFAPTAAPITKSKPRTKPLIPLDRFPINSPHERKLTNLRLSSTQPICLPPRDEKALSRAPRLDEHEIITTTTHPVGEKFLIHRGQSRGMIERSPSIAGIGLCKGWSTSATMAFCEAVKRLGKTNFA